MRLGIAGLHVESCTFSPLATEYDDFLATRGAGMLARYPFLSEPEFAAIEPVPLAHFRALPGGRVRRTAYEAMKAEILERLAAAGPLDAFYFDVHGAMAVEGLDDAEADLLAALRARLPPGLPVTCSQDLHGNLSASVAGGVDLITAYRTAPHVDVLETRARALRLLLRWQREGGLVHRAWVGVPVLVSGEMSSTESEPGRTLYAPLAELSARPGVWDASLWIGYAWADQPRSRAAVTVCGPDRAAVVQAAEELAQSVWQARREFRFLSPAGPAAWCLQEALRHGGPAVFCSDAGDNPTAGGAGDVTHTLRALVEHPAFGPGGPATAIFASIPDPAALDACAAAGPGATVTLDLGGKLDPVHGAPLLIKGVVERIVAECASIPTPTPPSPISEALAASATVRVGNVRILLTRRRKPFHKRADFLEMGVDPLEHTVTVVKIGYLEPELKAMARHHLLVLSPGAVNPLIAALPFSAVSRPLFPLDPEMDWTPEARVFSSEPSTSCPRSPAPCAPP